MSWFGWMDLAALSPLVILALGAFIVLLADAFVKAGYALAFISLGTLATAAFATLAFWAKAQVTAGGSLALGPFALYFALLILASAAVAVLYSIDYARLMGFEVGEYFALILLATCGMCYLVAANELISLFIGFELMSLAIYALAGVWRADPKGGEGAMKYFVLGSFASAFLLYGLALLYGATGTIYLDRMYAMTAGTMPAGLLLASIGLLMVGFGFKVGAVPFHAWIPDAYQGAPASVTGFMAVAVKAAAFAVFLRVLGATGLLAHHSGGAEIAKGILGILAIATMLVGNIGALAQTNIQRLLAYSGIAHSGYVLVGLTAATQESFGTASGGGQPGAAAGALYYLVGYAAMTIGAFAVLTTLRRDGRPVEDIEDLAGLARERPGAALAMTLFMVSLIGIPPTAGFMGKLWIFRAAVAEGFTTLVTIAVLTTAVSVYYYLRVVVVMYMTEPETAPTSGPEARVGFGGSFATALAAAAVLGIGMFPAAMLESATRGVAALMGR